MGENPTHSDDLTNVNENDTLTVETADGNRIEITCTNRSVHNSPDPDLIRETTTWTFDHDGDTLMTKRTEGIAGHPNAGPFPKDVPLVNTDTDDTIGFITSVELMGAVVA